MCASQCGHFFKRRIVLAKNHISSLEQALARFRQNHSPRRPHKKLDLCFVFQLSNLHADGRLRDMDAHGAGGKGPAFGDGYKSFQLSDVHKDILHQRALLHE